LIAGADSANGAVVFLEMQRSNNLLEIIKTGAECFVAEQICCAIEKCSGLGVFKSNTEERVYFIIMI
jgi:hypothetical protein